MSVIRLHWHQIHHIHTPSLQALLAHFSSVFRTLFRATKPRSTSIQMQYLYLMGGEWCTAEDLTEENLRTIEGQTLLPP